MHAPEWRLKIIQASGIISTPMPPALLAYSWRNATAGSMRSDWRAGT